MTEPSASCPFCEKKGLPILPLRAAIARTDYEDVRSTWKALDLPANMSAGITDIALPAQSAKYTGRLLRPGYLYVFNEARGEWKAYLVTGLGYLYEFDITDTTPPDADKIEFSCFRTGEEFVARCITIPDAQQAGKVWLGFSDTAWTPLVLDRHRKQVYREKHMRVVDIKQWLAGSTSQPHTAPFNQLPKIVNEFAIAGTERGGEEKQPEYSVVMDSETGEPEIDPETGQPMLAITLETVKITSFPPLNFSPHRFEACKHEAPGLMDWAAAAAQPHEPMLVAVDDPVGITMEIAALMGNRLQDFLGQEDLERPLAISALVDSLEEAIRNQAELDEIHTRQQKAVSDLYYWKKIPVMSMDGIRDPVRDRMQTEHLERMSDPVYRKQWEAKIETAKQSAADALTQSDLDDIADKAWKKYRNQLRSGEPDAWRKRVYQPRLEKFDREQMVPLAKAHCAWLTSDATTGSFICNHDDTDAESGAGYVQALLLCIQDTQQNQICFDTYQDWLTANTADPRNLLQRALLYNQQEVIEALDKAVPGKGLPKGELPDVQWKTLIALYGKSLKHLDAGGQNIVAQLLTAVGGPVIRVLNGMIDNTVGRLVIALGIIGEAPITMVTHVGTVDEALDVMVRLMKEINPEALENVDTELLKRRLEIQSRGRRQTIQTRGESGRFGASKVALRVDRFAVTQIKAGLTPAQAAAEAAGAALRMNEWPKNDMARFRAMFGTNSRLAVIGLVLQIVGANSMATKLDTSMSHKRSENNWRFRSSVAAIVGGVGNLIHDGVVAGGKAGNIRLAKAASTYWVKVLGVVSRGIGVVAAGIVAVIDARSAWREYQRGNAGMVWLYALSAATGLGAALLFGGAFGALIFGVSATGVGLILVVIGIAIALLVEFFKTDELQDWLERCLFGALDAGRRYQDLNEEMKQFGLAMKALGFKSDDETAPATAVPEH
ncbi:T6SS effector BTH_I2691 family protein [Lysobacter sp. H23M47]|uniref:T6SS effector BTH_I2691 family protein n=1 Tax=Lysobacter sp. H23M47 TaxID=2781024 RepID=UPI00188301C0|nr:T6SS effector BTH_I2691 family protein [Lysobacter sp. H23M47]QOW24777.1 hypothetical protein INQ43_01450 [Lysobacter sp. H23M47]